jgi:hypothetical protein
MQGNTIVCYPDQTLQTDSDGTEAAGKTTKPGNISGSRIRMEATHELYEASH